MVKSEWFWASIQMDACADEKLHVFSDHLGSLLSPVPQQPTTPIAATTAERLFSPGTPGSSSSAHSRKRKRRKEVVNQLAQNDPVLVGNKRRSSVSELAMLSMSGSLLDTPDRTIDGAVGGGSGKTNRSDSNLLKKADGSSPNLPNIVVTSPQGQGSSTPKRQAVAASATAAEQQPKQITARQHVFHELVQTETNYVNILRTILEVRFFS